MLYRWWTDPARLRRIAEAYLEKRVNGWVSVGSATFSWSEGVRLVDVAIGGRSERGVGIADGDGRGRPAHWDADGRGRPAHLDGDGADGGAGPIEGLRGESIVSCPLITLDLNRRSLVSGRLDIESIIAQRPSCRVVRDRITERTNIAALFLPMDATAEATFNWPRIELRDARLMVIERTGAADRVLEDITLTVRGGPAPDAADGYDVFWQEPAGEGGQSRIDVRRGVVRNVRGGLPWMKLGAVMQLVDVRFEGVGGWSAFLGLRGRVRARDYDVGADRPRSATIELRRAGVSIPVNSAEEGIRRAERYLNFDSVDGTIRLTRNRVDAQFEGRLHGSPCHVEATFRSTGDRLHSLDDVDFEASLRVTDLAWPLDAPDAPASHRRFIDSLPGLRAFYDHYQPTGRLDLLMSLAKPAGDDEPVVLRHALMSLEGASACVSQFPYSLDGARGVIEIGPEGVFIEGLDAFHDTTHVRMGGSIERWGDRAEIRLDVDAEGARIDDDLLDALPPEIREIVASYHPAGSADVSVRIAGTTGDEPVSSTWHHRVTVRFDDLSVQYDHFPYPLRHVSGSLEIDEAGIAVREVQGRRGDARVSVDGTVSWDAGGVTDVALAVAGQEVPFDAALLAAVPERLGEALAGLHPKGTFDTVTALGWDAEREKVDTESYVFVEDVTLRPDALPLEIEQVAGTVTLGGGRAEFDDVTGVCHGAEVAFSGWADLDPGGEMNLSLKCRNLALTGEVIDALPERLGRVLRTWRIEGPISTATTWRRDAGGDARIATDVTLRSVTLRHPRLPAPVEALTGQLRLDGEMLTLTDANGRYAGGLIGVDGRINTRFGDAPADVVPKDEESESPTDRVLAELRITAGALPLGEAVRDLLPERMRSAWDEYGPAGIIDVDVASLRCTASETGAPTWNVVGGIELHDAALAGVLEMKSIDGQIAVEGLAVDARGGLILSGDLDLRRCDILGRRIEEVFGRWSWIRRADGVGRLDMTGVEGRMYDGSLMAEHIRVRTDPPKVTYDLRATAHSVELDRFVGIGRSTDESAEPTSTQDFGWIDAQISLSGTANDPRTRRGWGGFDILDARIYRLPIIWKILTFLDVTAPSADEAFNRASARFNLVGNRMELEGIRLAGPTFGFEGAGRMSLPDRHVNIELRPMSDPNDRGIPFFSEIIEGAARGMVGLRVTGPLSDPKVRARSLPGVEATLRELFVRKKEDGRR